MGCQVVWVVDDGSVEELEKARAPDFRFAVALDQLCLVLRPSRGLGDGFRLA